MIGIVDFFDGLKGIDAVGIPGEAGRIVLLHVASERLENSVKRLNPLDMRLVPVRLSADGLLRSMSLSVLFLVVLDHPVAPELGTAEHLSDDVYGFCLIGDPSQDIDTLGDSGEMLEQGRCSIGFSYVIDDAHS